MQVNDEIRGFLVMGEQPVGELKAVLYRLRHGRTGLELAWLKREEENKTFGIAFRTLPEDDTGVFHILEHSVLCGSERYPVKEPFVELLKSSLNTFLNAMTFPDKTVYPVSSRNPKDFLNLARVYLDAVFRPAIYHRPEIFGQEGWHHELAQDGTVSYKGVVFNEMKGAFADAGELEMLAINRAMFPDTPYRYESGGDPASIPNLTYEQFIAAHKKFYCPANALVFLDGDVELDSVLALLEEYLAGAPAGQPIPVPAMQSPVKAADQEVEFELSPEEDPAARARLAWCSVIGAFDQRERIVATQILSQALCGSNQAPLNKVVLSQGLAEKVSMSVMDGVHQPWVQLEVRNLNAANAGQVEEAIFGELRRLCGEGLDRQQVEAALTNLEFQMRERDYGRNPQGLMFCLQMLDSWLYGGDPAMYLEVGDLFDRLREKLAEGWFEQLLRELMLDSGHCCKVTMIPSHTAGEKRRGQEQARLDRERAAWSDADMEAVRERQAKLDAWQNSEDSPEDLAKLPHLTLADVSEQPEDIPTKLAAHAGLPVIEHEVAAGGIAYLSLYFDVTGCCAQELSALSLLCGLLGKIDTEEHTAEELHRLTQTICGDMEFGLSVFGAEGAAGQCTVKLCASFSALERNAVQAAELVTEILCRTRFDKGEAVMDILRQAKMGMFQQLVMNGHAAGIRRVCAQLTASSAAEEYASGVAFYQWLKDQEENWDWEALRGQLKGLLAYAACGDKLTLSATGAPEGYIGAVAGKLAQALPHRTGPDKAQAPAAWGKRREGVEIPADVSFACTAGSMGRPYSGLWPLAARVVRLAYLWNVIRVQGGAYGTGMVARDVGGLVGCYSFRDPKGSQSLERYRECAGFLRRFCQEGPDLTGMIIGAVSDESPLLTPRMKGMQADGWYWKGVSWERRCQLRRELLSATPEALAELADSVEQALIQGGVCVLGPRAELERCGLDEIVTL